MRARLLIAAALFMRAAAFAATPLPDENARWYTVDAGDFHVYGNTSPRQTRQIALNLLRMQEAVAVVTRLNVHAALPVYVYLFRDERSFAPYRSAVFGAKKTEFTGAFHTGRDGNFVMMRIDADDRASRVVFHELTHLFVRNTIGDPPPWFNEGLAEYYSTFASSGESVALGKAIPEHLGLLRTQPLIPLRDFFAMDYRAYTESDRVNIYYAEAWAIVHYLLEQPDRAPLARFLALLSSRQPAEAAFTQAFALTYEQFEQRLRGYVNRSIFAYTSYAVGDLHVPPVAEPQPMSRAAVLTACARLLIDTGHPSDAAAFLEEALRVAPDDAAAQTLLKRMHDERQVLSMAGAPTRLGNDDIVNGFEALQAARRTLDAERNTLTLHARELFTRAARKEPASADALAGLGATYTLTDEDPSPGIAALEKAVAGRSIMPDAVPNLVFLYARAGRLADAQAAAQRQPVDQRFARLAQSSLADGIIERAKRLAAQGKQDDAVAWMRTSIASTPDADVQRQLTTYLESLTAASAADWSDFQLAVDEANSRKYAEALKIADRLLAKTADRVFRDQVQTFRKEVARRAGK